MKTAILPRSEFRAAISTADLVVERRNTIPILSNVLLRAAPDGDGLDVIGTDLDIYVTARVPGAVDPDFSVTMPARALRDLEKKASKSAEFAIDMPDVLPVPRLAPDHSDADLDAFNAECERVKAHNALSDGMARLDFGGFAARMQTLPQEDFPESKISGPVVDFVMPASALRNALERVSFAISTEETRYYLNGVYMHVPGAPDGEPSTLRFVTTDGHKLARHEIACPAGAGAMQGVIIPRKTVAVLCKLLKAKGAPECVDVRVNSTKAVFTIGNVSVLTKLIDGTFPDYQRVIPSGNDKRVTFGRNELAGTIEAVSTISSERGRAVKLSIIDGACTLSVSNPDAGTSRATIACDTFDVGIGLDIGFNAKYLLDILARCDGERVTFMFADAGSPTLIRSAGDDGASTLFVCMPMRV